MEKIKMKCQKCNDNFEEKDIQVSHDIPKYLGGTDADGRHALCEICHKEYEFEVLKFVLMNYLKMQSEFDKAHMRRWAGMVKGYYFKNKIKKDDDTKTITTK